MSNRHIVRVTADETRRMKDESDWAQLEAEEAAGIEPPWDPEGDFEVDCSKARWAVPEPK